jgi:ribonuclease HII
LLSLQLPLEFTFILIKKSKKCKSFKIILNDLYHPMLQQYYTKDSLEVGLDEAGRGCLLGPVCVAGVIWLDEDPIESMVLKDSKKCTKKYRESCYQYIIDNCISYSVQLLSHEYIDQHNILKSSIDGMHLCLDDISDTIDYDTILVDGNHFKIYYNKHKDEYMDHHCIIQGDNTYKSIAAASILAKTYRDNYIDQLVKDHPELEKYDIHNNKGYGTKKHIDAIHTYGITQWHRKSFKPCNLYI